MKKGALIALTALMLAAAPLTAQQDTAPAQGGPEISKKQEIAVFALGYYGWEIPQQALASIDNEIQDVFVNLGRFTVIGQTQRFSQKDVNLFIDIIKKSKQENFVLPDEFKFGEKAFTEADFNKIMGAFIVAIPTVVDYNAQYNRSQRKFECNVTTSVAFINVADGTTFGYANIKTSGESKETLQKAVRGAIDSIPIELTYEIRKIEIFQIKSRVLKSDLFTVKMQLGRDMGVKVGDEYAVMSVEDVGGFKSETESGLILINNVGSTISTGTILYSGPITPNTQLQEVPRLGIDIAPYVQLYNYFKSDSSYTYDSSPKILVGAKAIMTRGFYGLRPLVGVQMLLNAEQWLPLSAYVGADYNIYLRRVQLSFFGAIGGTTNIIFQYINDKLNNSDNNFFSHYGVKGGVDLTYLMTRDIKIGASAGFEYWIPILPLPTVPQFQGYGGTQLGASVTVKL
jgi:hypothetical protein